MAIYKIFPEKDTTLYSQVPDMNTGRDEILELSSYSVGQTSYVSRPLLQFRPSDITNVLETYVSSSTRLATDFSASLKLYLASANELPTEYSIQAYPVYVGAANYWTVGNGKYGDLPRNSSGASWGYINYTGSAQWSMTTNVTQSYSGSTGGGGSWYYNLPGYDVATYQDHGTNSTHDVDVNVTDIVKAHYQEAITNAGIVLKLSSSLEFNAAEQQRQLYLKYFSSDTHTIYPPCLEIKWNDYADDSTGAVGTVSDPSAVVKVKNNKGRYTDEGKQRFELSVRPKYPTRTFATSSNYLTNYYLPEESYWGIRDENTEEMVIDYDTVFTKISRGATANYFDVYMDGLEPERYYRVLIKTTINGSTNVLDENLVFKVVRNV